MSFSNVNAQSLQVVADRLERLTKSWQAGYQGLNNAGRTNISALAGDNLDPVIRSITATEDNFLLTKEIDTIDATSSVYMYALETQIQSGLDLAGAESFLPQEDAGVFQRVATILKVYGVKKSISQMAQLSNDAGAYIVDLEKKNDQQAAMAMGIQLERDGYVGADYYMDANGQIDSSIIGNINGPIRNMAGIQNNVREGDQSTRGIPGDFIGYGNSRSVVFDRAGAPIGRDFADEVVTAVRDNLGSLEEAHCTTSQLAEFRKTFFPFERGDLGSNYAIHGAGVTNDYKKGFPLQTVAGVVMFIPNVFKYAMTRPRFIQGTYGTPPAAPTTLVVANSASGTSSFAAGDVYHYVVQSINISGTSAVASQSGTTTVATSGKCIDLTWDRMAGAERYAVFRTPQESTGTVGKEWFIGYVTQPTNSATVTFRDANRLIPGLDTIVFMPKDKDRVKLAKLGNLLNKLDLGLRGLASEKVYASYTGVVLDRPRTYSLADNVFQKREGI